MFKIKGNYPNPILLDTPIDFKTSKLQIRYLYKSQKNGHVIKIECDINNNEINELIKSKKVCYAIQIESPNAFFRKMYEFFDEKDIEIFLSNDEIVDYIEIGVALLAKEEIESYINSDFIDEYQGIDMKVAKNGLIGVFPSVKQPIISKQEILKEVTTIFNIEENENAKEITYDTSRDRIRVTIPSDIGEYYKRCKGNNDRINILNSLIFVPVLSSVLADMSIENEDDSFSSKLWYKSLYVKIEELSKKNNKSIEELLENSFETAQHLMHDLLINSVRTFKILIDEIEDEYKGDED